MARLPEMIDKYPVEALVASGGMGEVYRAQHPTLERPVIIKKLTLRGNDTITERFRREARILLDFRNDFIVDVQDHFVKGRTHYIVMEYVDGLSVKDLLEERRYLDNGSAAYIALCTARALAYAHRKGVIHRDIKPGNILISRKGEVKLADFGIATSSEAEDETLTTDGMTLGTPSYMAPEQFRSSRTVDYRADLYSLGVMLYEMLSGRKPYAGSFSPELMQKIEKGRYRSPGRINPGIHKELRAVIRWLMRSKPSRRPGSAELLVKRLERYLKRYSLGEIQERLSLLASGNLDSNLPSLHWKSRKALPLAAGLVFLAGILFLAGSYLHASGIFSALVSDEPRRLMVFSIAEEDRPVSVRLRSLGLDGGTEGSGGTGGSGLADGSGGTDSSGNPGRHLIGLYTAPPISVTPGWRSLPYALRPGRYLVEIETARGSFVLQFGVDAVQTGGGRRLADLSASLLPLQLSPRSLFDTRPRLNVRLRDSRGRLLQAGEYQVRQRMGVEMLAIEDGLLRRPPEGQALQLVFSAEAHRDMMLEFDYEEAGPQLFIDIRLEGEAVSPLPAGQNPPPAGQN